MDSRIKDKAAETLLSRTFIRLPLNLHSFMLIRPHTLHAMYTSPTGFSYSNKSKRKILGVKKSTLEKHGAVSEGVAKEMVKGAALFTKADVAVAVTGIAGPDGGSEEKPVGLVYIACNVCGRINIRYSVSISGVW